MRPSTLALLSICARPGLPPDLRPELARRGGLVEHWDEALDAAERHGLGPLLYHHLRGGHIDVPPAVAAQLQGLYVRHRRSNGIRLSALGEILDAFDTRQIPVRVLKGPALIDLVYGDPALRPLSDLDLLLSPQDVFRAQQVLRDLGFRAPGARSRATMRHHHHLPMATRPEGGILVQVELHHDVFSPDDGVSMRLDEPRETPTPLHVLGRDASTLGTSEMLWHLCQHLVGPFPRPLRLIWIADALGYAEKFSEELDWARVGRQYAIVLYVLGLAHTLTPLPPQVLRHVPRTILDEVEGVGADCDVWSLPSDPGAAPVNRTDRLTRTLLPPPWWLRVRYGTQNGAAGPVAGQVRHLSAVTRAVLRRGWRALEGGREA